VEQEAKAPMLASLALPKLDPGAAAADLQEAPTATLEPALTES